MPWKSRLEGQPRSSRSIFSTVGLCAVQEGFSAGFGWNWRGANARMLTSERGATMLESDWQAVLGALAMVGSIVAMIVAFIVFYLKKLK